MKLTDAISNLIKKKEDGKAYYFSLYVDVDAAAVAVWSVGPGKEATIASFAHSAVPTDTWESRIQVVDRLLSAAEEKVGPAEQITKTVFGLPTIYLTSTGNISDAVRPHLKHLTEVLELKPVGFVPLSQAIAYQLKNDEGVPPSVILIGCSGKTSHVTLFRIGKRMSDDEILLTEDPAMEVEAIIKKHQDGDVLPSRMLLYGGNAARLDDLRAKLLKHPWPSRANFLHFPKIEIVSIEPLLSSVSLAGAAELAADMGEDEVGAVSTAVAQPSGSGTPPPSSVTEEVAPLPSSEETPEEILAEEQAEAPEEVPDEGEIDGEGDETETADSAETIGEAIEQDEKSTAEDIANVELVTPESLGFQKEDILEKAHITPVHAPHKITAVNREALEEAAYEDDEEKPAKKFKLPVAMPNVSFSFLQPLKDVVSNIHLPGGAMLPIAGGGVVLVIVLAMLWYFVPKTTVTILLSPQTLEQSAPLTVNPTATVADPASKIIPGHTQTKTVSGDKTIAVTGKKDIGNPAKGTVTIYNKVTDEKTFAKGSSISSNGLVFTLDGDVTVASASEDVGSITFGKGTANVTAKVIGPNGNLPAGSDFTFSGIDAANASARNDAAFTGGTSKQVTVVSRADQDALVKALTDDLVGQAKSQLAAAATGGERLIDATVKTSVSDKSFDQEVDQQSAQLHGKITIAVSGISISDDDIKGILTSLVQNKVPTGYTLSDQSTVSVSNVVVKKDGTITLSADLKAIALPKLDTAALQAQLVGKDVSAAQAILKQTQGVAGVVFSSNLPFMKSWLPANKNNITITTTVQQ